jgi:hypothetical protein
MPKRSTKKRNQETAPKLLHGSVIETWDDVKPKHLTNRTAQVFISSLNGYPLDLSPDDDSILTTFRKYLVKQIEDNFRFLSADINEGWAAGGAGNPRDITREFARNCHVFVGILVDSYGFTDLDGLSATIIEFDAAREHSPEKMLVFIQRTLRNSESEVFKNLPPPYQKLLVDLQAYRSGKLVKYFDTWQELSGLVLEALDQFSAKTLIEIRRMPPYASNKSPEETNWEQMTFRERHENMRQAFRTNAVEIRLDNSVIESLSPDPTAEENDERYQLAIKQKKETVRLPILLSACPDRFSYSDAAAYVGYPFRTRVQSWQESMGPLDIILFFRTATDAQIRRHLGNPDIHVTREGWGYFAADPERYIQAAYLVNCTSSRDLDRKVRQFLTWLDEYEQVGTLIERARIRGRILQAERDARIHN